MSHAELHEEFYAAALGALTRHPDAEVQWRDAEPPGAGLAAVARAQGQLAVPGYVIGDLAIVCAAVPRNGRVELALFPQQRGDLAFALDGDWFRGAVQRTEQGAALDPQLRTARIDDYEPTDPPADLSRARLAAAFDLLGCCDALVDMAVTYARDREQFGRPIGEFQAVQHLLAEAHVQREGVRALCLEALSHEALASIAKAIAGTAARRIAQATLQVLGAIGFTREHAHQRYYRRVMVLDAAFGSERELHRELGRAAAAGPIERIISPR